MWQLRLLVALPALAVVVAGSTGAAAAAGKANRRGVDASFIARKLAAGNTVVEDGVVVHGELRLPSEVSGALIVRNSVFLGPVIGASTSFHSLVDFSNSSFRQALDLSDARFDGPLLFAGVKSASERTTLFSFAVFNGSAIFASARFLGPVSFDDAQFHGESRFENDQFAKTVSFRFVGFDHGADFGNASFNDTALFGRDEFSSTSDFSNAQFEGTAAFDDSRFVGATDFTAATFIATHSNSSPTSFRHVQFDGGAVFLQTTFAQGANFERTEATQEMDFEHAMFWASTSFVLARFLANADFTHAEFSGMVNLDQAEFTRLDLDGASLAASHVFLPDPARGGHLDALRMDPAAVTYVGVGRGHPVARERALALIETADRSGGDLRAAAEAGVRRLTLARNGETLPVRALDWLFYWQIGGYFLRPWHPFLAILTLIVIFAIVRSAVACRVRAGWYRRALGFGSDLFQSTAALWGKGKQNTATRIEAILQKVLVAVLLLNLSNVWPPVAGLLKGVLP